MYNKRIICDIDDTISITLNRDWENAVPIQSTIDKLKQFRRLGWEIWLVTARGQLSCDGDSEAADRKYRPQIEKWLHDHDVPYDLLSFNKPLATYYIDDKALSPEQFQSLSIRKLEGGWAGSDIELRDGRVYKTADNSVAASRWYSVAASFVRVPKIYSLIGNTICMQYINNNSPINIHELILTIEIFKKMEAEGGVFLSYWNRIRTHCRENDKFQEVVSMMGNDLFEVCSRAKSFSHGDFSLENILVEDGAHYFIDPIYEPGQFSSYLLDVAKLLHSFRKYNRMVEYKYLFNHFAADIEPRYLRILEITQWVRVYKYAPAGFKPTVEKMIYKLIDEC